MSTRSSSLLVLALLPATLLAAPVAAQWREPTLSSSVSATADSARSAFLSAPGFAEEKSWRERNAVAAGALVGGAIGFGFALRNAYGNDFRCPAEWMVPCWIEFPILTAYGAGIGAFFGWIISLPVKAPPADG
jgi:hypothetical protein